MFNLTYTIERDTVGTIRYKPGQYPKRLGPYTDADGNRWDIAGLFSAGFEHGWCQAAPYHALHPYFTSTDDCHCSWVEQVWMPYKLEEIQE